MTVRCIKVDVPGAAYEVVIGRGCIREVGARLAEAHRPCKVALISDETVAERYGTAVDSALARSGFSVTSMSVPAGEQSKSWEMAGQILEALASSRFGRDDLVVALGGGVVGDLAGFVAGVYMRGITFAQLPTTLLAMVDSSVGGKTAVDLPAGKNLVGAFKQPVVVIADTALLDTLPEREWASGLAEVAKSAVLDGEEFAGWLEQNAAGVSRREPDLVEEVVARCVAFKASVVARDETEEGPRECLNYGHTLGHAIEKVAGYGVYTHGAAVAEGMRFAARVSADMAGASAEFVRRQDRLLDALGLPPMRDSWDVAALQAAMYSDKKAREGVVRMVLVERPGAWSCRPVGETVVNAHLKAWAASRGE